MADNNVNININDNSNRKGSAGGIAGKAAQTSVNDPASITKLARLLKSALEENSKKTGDTIDKAISKLVRVMVEGAGGGSISDANIKSIMKGVGKELGNEVVKSIAKTLPKSSVKKQDSTAITKAIDNSVVRAANKMAKTISSRLSKQENVSVDATELSKGIASSMRRAVPASTDKATRELIQSVGATKAIFRDIKTLVSQIGSMRKSEGKVDVGEISSVLVNIKRILTNFKALSREASNAKESLKDVSLESKQMLSDLTTAIDNVKRSAEKTVSGVKQRAIGDPKDFTKEIVTSVVGIINKSESLKGTSLEKAVRSLEGKVGDMAKLSTELQKFQKTFKKEITSGTIKIEGIERVLNEFDQIVTKLGNVPKQIGVDRSTKQTSMSKPSKEWEDFTNSLSRFTQRTTKLITQIKLIVDDSEIRKMIPDKIDVKITPKVESKTIYDEVEAAITRALYDAEKTKITPKVEPVVSKIEVALNNKDLAGIRRGLADLSKIKIDSSQLIDDLRKRINVIEGSAELKIKAVLDTKSYDDMLATKVKADHKRLQAVLDTTAPTTVGSIGRSFSKIDAVGRSLYKQQTVKPVEGGEVKRASTIRILSKGAQGIKRDTEQNIKALSASLYKLQDQVVSGLEKQFSDAEKKWAVVKPAGGTAKDAFKLTPGERQWTMQIANLDRLQRIMKDFDSGVMDLVNAYKAQVVQERVTMTGGPQKQADLIGQWLKTVSAPQIKSVEGLDSITKSKLSKIKTSFSGTDVSDEMRTQIRNLFGDVKLENIFRKTYAESEAKRELQSEGLVKQIALPAAKVTKTGSVSFQTVHGAERALSKFAKFETGFEKLYEELTGLAIKASKEDKKQIFTEARSFIGAIKELGVRPGPDNLASADALANKMLSSIVKNIGDKNAGSKYARRLYTDAAASKRFAVKEAGGDPVKFMKDFEAAMSRTYKSFDEFSDAMKEINLSAYDVAKSLNSIEVTNVYDIIGKVLQGSKGLSPITTLGESPQFERSVRGFEKAISEIEGLMPLLEQNRPRRGFHQESVVNLMARTAPFYEAKDRLDPDAQKKLIKDLNLAVNETLTRIKQTNPVKLPGNLQTLTSLGIPESQAGNIEEYRPGGTGQTKFLKSLQATGIKLYSQDLTAQAPFQQFQQTGRNISNISNAMVDLAGSAELPKLRSTKERAIIESGRYGEKGYGYNVTAELRNTAANFEDQIVIAGKLATALTSAVSNLVKPSATGRVRGATTEERISGTGVTELKEQEITKVARKYMSILGVPEEYKGRADKVLIKEVRKAVSVVRGEDVEVQQAKLAETFLNYFGRKLTTRYGSKGVSVTPTGPTEKLSDIISKYSGTKIKLDPSQTLGAAFVPKTVGKLVSELFGDKVSQELKTKLIASGNKFIIDIFQKTGEGAVVAADEAKKTAELYKEFASAWEDVFSSKVPSVGIGGIAQIRGTYQDRFGDKALKEVKPIDVRISSYGAAKRGLQTEFLESIFSNVAGTGQGGVTTVQKLDKPAYEGLLKRGGLSKYSEALGFKGSGKTEAQIAPELYSKFTGKPADQFAAALASGDDKAVLAKRAASLEAASSFYSDLVDEFGNKRTGLIGEKFLQIVEEPGENPEWQRGQIDRGMKGARLNLPAFSAYATVFGEQSSFMKELQGSLDVNAKKHWEYTKALQTIQDEDSTVYKNITKGLKTVDISDIKPFDLSTGVYGKKYITDEAGNQVLNQRSFDDTILDLNKFSEAFKIAIPTGKYGPEGEIKKKEFYVPAAPARGTYPEPLLAGERGMDQITRRLSHFVNMAKELQEVMENPDKSLDANDIRKKIPPIIGTWISESWDIAKSKAPDAEEQLSGILNKMFSAMSTTSAPSSSLINTSGRTEQQFAQDFYKGQINKVSQGLKTKPEAMATTISTMGDLLVGKKKGTPEQLAAPTGLTRALDQGIGGVFAQKLGIDVVQDTIDKRVSALNKARIDYYNALADAATGKTGSINELLFSRKIPAVMGKAVTAVVDKRDDITKFGKDLATIESKYGVNLGVSADSLADISKKHSEAVVNYQKIGVPVLKETELGVPTTFAKKIPLDFVKKFVDTKDPIMGVKEQKPESVSGTLYDLLKYIDKIREGAKKESPGMQDVLSKYIDDELVPYIESIRYPFTGTSSITPFKPKLLEEKDYQTQEGTKLSRNVLVAPGVPEGLDELSPILSTLQDRLKAEMSNRERLQKTGAPKDEIERATGLIRDLSAAIAEVIPKYTSQAQKLDFDGDQIELHSARTASARKDIESHFKRFHIRDSSRDPYTADVFRTQFLSEAPVASTGKYVLGESSAAFEKKFPAGKGFDFLQSPFLTKELEYLSSGEALNVLKDNPNIGNVENVIKDVLVTQNKPINQIASVMETIGKVDTSDADKATQNIMEAISVHHADLMAVIEKGIKKRLYEEKLGDAIEAQLFKVHTGTETEALYRVQRLAESTVGFGGGEITGRPGKSSEYFQSRFPSSLKSMGGRPEEEFNTMMNEMVRFGIQKGMDVKHAGEKPVAGEMVGYLTRGVKGATELWSRVQDENDKTFGDLRDFAGANESAVKMRLGALSTSDIMSEAKKVIESRGEKMDVSGMDREALIQLMVDKIGFKGFLEELSRLIKKEAIDGLIAQAETWTSAKKKDPGGDLPEVKGSIKDWANQAVQQQMERGGINIRQDIIEGKQPLYGMRTFFASPAAEYNKYRGKFGDMPVPEEKLEGLSEKDAKSYKFKYRKAAATAFNIKQELRAFAESKQGGAYADMVRGAVDTLYSQQEEVEKYITTLIKEGYNPDAAKGIDIAERTLSRSGVSDFANAVLNMRTGMKDEVSRLSDLAGVPGLSDTEMFGIRRESSEKFADIKQRELKNTGMSEEEVNASVKDYVDRMVDKAQALTQLDRVIDSLVSKKFEGRVLQDLLPRPDKVKQYSTYDKTRGEVFTAAREKMKFKKGRARLTQPDTMAFGEDSSPARAGMMGGAGGVVPVHLVGTDPGVTLNVKGLEGLGLVERAPTDIDRIAEIDTELQQFAKDTKELGDILKKTKPQRTGGRSTSYEDFYSPSKFAGGGFAYGGGAKKFTEEIRLKEQVDRIARDMVSRETLAPASQALADWGSVIHAKFEKSLEKKGNVDVEKYGEFVDDVGGIIGGFADIVEYEGPEKKKVTTVADIKTVGADKFEKIKSAVEKAGSTDFAEVAKQLDDNTARQLEDYFSQLNAYLKIFDETAKAEIRFYDREGRGENIEDYTAVSFGFDPERFQKDMKALAVARTRVKQTGGKFLRTNVRNQAVASKPEGATTEELDRAIELAKQAYERERGGGIRAMASGIGASKRGKAYENARKGTKSSAEQMSRNKMYKNLTPSELDKYLVPPQAVEGETAEAFLTNLKILHDQSKLYQKSKGLSMDTVEQMPKQIKESIEGVKGAGPDYQSFIDLTGKLKDMDRPDFTGMDMIKAWKLYRIAVGDWLLKRADDAYEEMQALEAAGDVRGSNQKYGDFTNMVSRAQEFVRRSVGKRTDIYTDDKRFVYPSLAQKAGVYMSPSQIMKKAGEPLGDDPKLIESFRTIVQGIKSETGKTPPVEAARAIFSDLSDMNKDFANILSDSEKFKRLGPEILDAWNFDKLTARTTRLRAALQEILRDNKEMDAEQRKNVENIVKYLKKVEGMYSHMNLGGEQAGYGQIGIVPVPKFETPANQRALYARNIQSTREYFRRPAEEGGPDIGERFSYNEKIVGQSGEIIKNVTHHFKKYGEELLVSGKKVGLFSESQQDLIEKMQKGNATFSNAVRRVTLWGAASRLVYGGVSNLKSSLDELTNIETGVASLRMVMSPLETDFQKMTKSSSGLAKQYGIPITDVLKSMKVFAQQGLKQGDVISRTKTATLASNVTTLNSKEATEALTAAMKVFREEGSQSLRFLDAWSEVEAKHAITADDMANAIKKSAAAAKSAGVNFDQLNGMVAAVGAVTRQTGKEVGTSFRFIFRRLFAEEGPKTLAKLKIPTLTPEGELRGAFDVLGDLAGKWDDLTSAQRMNVAQSIGGTRQYNSILVLMDQWDEALRGIRNSTNSKGSAERRNAEIMKTYGKQLARTKAAATEFKMEIGSIALPVFTTGAKSLTFLFEALTAIPAPIKAATAALAAFFTLGAKGINLFDSIGGGLKKGASLFGNLGNEFSKQMKIAKYEISGKADATTDIFGLKTLTPTATKIANTLKQVGSPLVEQGDKMSDFHSSIGKMMSLLQGWGRGYNEMIGGMIVGTGALTEKVGEGVQDVGSFLSVSAGGVGGLKGLKGILQGGAERKGLSATVIKSVLKGQGVIKGGAKLLSRFAMLATEIVGLATYLTGQVVDAVGEQVGAGGHKILKDFTTQNTGFVKSVAPLALTVAAMVPAIKAASEYFGKMTNSAQDFEKTMEGTRRKNESQLKSVRDMVQEYEALSGQVKNVEKVRDPKVKARRQELGTYESPLTTLQKVQGRSIDLTNQIADSNQNLVVGYDNLGNAVLKTGKNFKAYLKDIENLDVKTGVATELEILGKYLDDLSSGNKTEKVKMAFKELAAAFPVIGDLVGRHIKVSPAQQLEVAATDLNKRLNLKQKYPLSTAGDADIKRLQGVLSKARDAYKDTFSDMMRVYSTVLSRANLRGLNKRQIEEVIGSSELRKAYEMQIKIDPRFKLVEGVKWQDIMGKELITAINPSTAGSLDVVSEFTKANLESAGVKPRSGKAASGDIVMFYKDMADKYNIAGAQAIVKLKDTDEWVIEYFNTRTLKLEERSLSDVDNMVESIFPLQKVKEDIAYRMDALNTFVAGASAGLTGLSKKDFKRDFNLGERFFGEIPTTTLLQGNKGFLPGSGYGELEGMKDFKNDIENYFFKPMGELRNKTEQFKKLQLEGLDVSDTAISKGFYDEINKLLDVLKNNQVVLQFKAVFVDLMKEMSTGQRVLREELAIMRRRADINVTPGGLTRGMPIGLENIDLGIRDVREVTARQSLLTRDPNSRKQATQLRAFEMTTQSNMDMIDKLERAIVHIDDISSVAEGFGASMSTEQLQNYVEKVVPERGEGPFYELTQIDKGIEQNTSNTVDKLDKILENLGDPEAVEKSLTSIFDNLGAGLGVGISRNALKTVNALERVSRVRKKAEGRGDQEAVISSNKALDILSKQLIAQVGYKKGMEMVSRNTTLFSKRFTGREFQQRAFSGVDYKVFLDRLKKYGPEKKGFLGIGGRPSIEESKVFKNFEKSQHDTVKQTTFSSKNLARVGAVTAALSKIQQSGNKNIISKIDEQISIIDQQVTDKRQAGAGADELVGLIKKRESLTLKRDEKRGEADFYGTVAAINATGFAAVELSKAFGLTEKQINALGVGAAGTYAAMVIASKVTGEQLPDSAKKFGEEIKRLGKKTILGEKPGLRDAKILKNAGKEMSRDFVDRTKKVFGKSAKDIGTAATKVDSEELIKKLDASLGRRAKSMKDYTSLGPDFAKYAAILKSQTKARSGLLEGGKAVDSSAYKDLIKQQNAEIAKFLRGLGREDKRDVLSKYPVTGKDDLHKYVAESFGPELEKTGEYMVRGLEKAEAPSKLKQAIVAYLAVGLSDYMSNKTADKTALAETEKIMKRQSEALAELIRKYPDAAEMALTDLQKEVGTTVAEVSDVATVDKSMVQDTKKAKESIKRQIAEIRDTYIEEQKKALDEQRKVQNKFADREYRENLKIQQETSVRDRRGKIDSFNISRRFSTTNLLNKQLKGFSGEVELPITEDQMSVQQRVYSDAGKSFRNVIDSFSAGVQQLEGMRNNLEMLKQAARVEEDLVDTTDDDDVKRRAKERHKDLNDAMTDQISVIGKFAEKLREFGKLKSLFDQFARSMYHLKDAIKDIGIKEAVESLPGMQQYKDRMNKLLGGSNPDVMVPVSTEESRMGSRVGMNLQHMRSTKYDVLEAQLRDQLRTASPNESNKIRRQLADLPEQRRRDIQVYKQREYDNKLRRGLQPYEEQVTALERVKVSPFISGKQSVAVEQMQQRLVEMLNSASERITIGQARKELKANKGSLTRKEYKAEQIKIDELEKQGITSTYKGIRPWDQKEVRGMSAEIQDVMKKAMVGSKEGLEAQLIYDPIVSAISDTNAILTMIAEKEFGIDYDTGFIDEMQDRASKIGTRGADKIKQFMDALDPIKIRGPFEIVGDVITRFVDRLGGFEPERKPFEKKSVGGRVFGAGGPKEDKVPAWLSPGEYVIRAHSAQKLGPKVLDYMNSSGNVPSFIPAFSNGGKVSAISDDMQNFVSYLESERLALSDKDMTPGSLMRQAGLATTELVTRLLKSPTDVGAMVEKIAGFAGSEGFGATLDVGKKIGSNLIDLIKGGITSEQVAKVIGGMKEGISKGGVGITTAILETLLGGTTVVKRMKTPTNSLKGQLKLLAKDVDPIVSEQAKDALSSQAVKELSKSKSFKKDFKYLAGGNEALVFKHGDKVVRLGGLSSPTALAKVRKGNIFSIADELTDEELLAKIGQHLTKREINEIGSANKFLSHGKFKDKDISISPLLDTEKVKSLDPVLGIRDLLEKQGAVSGNYGQTYFSRGKSGQFYQIGDLHPGNFGFDKKGKLLGIDPGMYKKTDWDKLPYDAQDEFFMRRQDPSLFDLNGKVLKKAEGGRVENWLKTAKEYWFGKQEKEKEKDDEKLLNKLAEERGISFDEDISGSYMETGKHKKARYDKVLGYANGGRVGIDVDERGRPIHYYTADASGYTRHDNKEDFDAAVYRRKNKEIMQNYASARTVLSEPNVLTQDEMRQKIEAAYGPVDDTITKKLFSEIHTPSDLRPNQDFGVKEIIDPGFSNKRVSKDRSFFKVAGQRARTAVDFSKDLYGVGKDVYGTGKEMVTQPVEALKTTAGFYDEIFGISDKAKAIGQFGKDVYGTGKEMVTQPVEALKTTAGFYDDMFGVYSKIKKTLTLSKDFINFFSDTLKNITDKEKRAKFIKEQLTDPTKNELLRSQDFFLNNPLVKRVSSSVGNAIRDFGEGFGSDSLANFSGLDAIEFYQSQAKAPDKIFGKLLNILGDFTPSGIAGKGEGVLSFLSSGAGTVLGGLSGLGSLPFGLDTAGKNQKFITDLFTYKPKSASKAGRTVDVLSSPFNVLGSLGEQAGDRVAEVSGSPTLGAMASTGIQSLPSLMPFAKGVIKSVADTTKYRAPMMYKNLKTEGKPSIYSKHKTVRKRQLLKDIVSLYKKNKKRSLTRIEKRRLKNMEQEVKYWDDGAVKGSPKALPAKAAFLGIESIRQSVKNRDKLKNIEGYAEGGEVIDEKMLFDEYKEEYKEWAIRSTESFQNKNFRGVGKGRGIVDSDSLPSDIADYMAQDFMGLGPQYDTDKYRDSLRRKKSFTGKLQDNRNGLKTAMLQENVRRSRVFTDTTDQVVGLPIKHVDDTRNLVGYGSDKLLHQTIANIRDNEWLTKEQGIVPKTKQRFMDDPEYRKKMETEAAAKKNFYDNILTPGNIKDFDLRSLPGHLGILKREYDQTSVALGYKGILPKEKETLEARKADLIGSMKKYMTGSVDFGVDTNYVRNYKAGKGITRFINERRREDIYREAIGDSDIDPMSAFYSSPRAFTDMMNKFRGGSLTKKDRKKYQKMFSSAINGDAGYSGPTKEYLEMSAKSFKKMTKDNLQQGPNYWATVPKSYEELLKLIQASKGLETTRDDNGMASFMPKMMDFFASMQNSSANVFHNGGVVSKTGKIFAEKGELVLPKAFAAGGVVGEPASTALSTTVRIDASEIISKLKNIELKVEDKEMKVEDRVLKIEDKEVKLEESIVKLDTTNLPKLEVDNTNIPTIMVDTTNVPTVQVDQPVWTIPVEVPNDPVTVKVDLGDAALQLSDSITKALNTAVQVEVSGAAGNAVGGEKFDQLAKTVETINDRLITVKSELEGEIEMLGSSNNQTTELDRTVSIVVNNAMDPVRKDMNDLRTNVSRIESIQRQQQTTLDARLDRMQYDVSLTQNVTGTGIGG